MLLVKQVCLKWLFKVAVEQRTFGDQRVNSLLSYLPRYSVDKQRDLDGVERTQHGIHLVLFSVKHLHESVNEIVHLKDAQDIKVLMDVE